MSYNVNIPNGTDPILKSQRQLKANYQAISQAFAKNHVNLEVDGRGNHSYLNILPQTIDPTIGANQAALMVKLVSTIPQLFFCPNNNQTPVQLTSTAIRVDSSNDQYSFIAGPFIVYAGFLPGATSNQLITLTPSSTLVYAGLTVANVASGTPIRPQSAAATNLTGSTFRVNFNTQAYSSIDAYYIAIGKP